MAGRPWGHGYNAAVSKLLGLLLCVLAWSACGGERGETLGTAPPFRVPALDGGMFDSQALQGKVVVLDFWATWCGPCIEELPLYNQFWQRNRTRGVEVLGVVVESGGPEEVAEFIREQGVVYRQLFGNEDMQYAFGATQGLPTTFVIAPDGRLVKRILGAVPGKFEELQATVDELLRAAGR